MQFAFELLVVRGVMEKWESFSIKMTIISKWNFQVDSQDEKVVKNRLKIATLSFTLISAQS